MNKFAAPADEARLKKGSYHGIFDPQRFSDYASLRTYVASPDVEPFIEHCWLIRWEVPKGKKYVASQMLWKPSFNLFVDADRAFISGIAPGKMSRTFEGTGVTAGIKFKPGGFYPFWRHDISTLERGAMPAHDVFPQATSAFAHTLLSLDDKAIVDKLEDLLRLNLPPLDNNVAKIQKILKFIEQADHTPSLAEVAQNFAMSTRSLQHLFQTYVGIGIKWIIKRTRFTMSLHYLHTTQKPDWSRISAELGYSDQSHFINDFKEVVGVSPKQYEKALQGDESTYTRFIEYMGDDLFSKLDGKK